MNILVDVQTLYTNEKTRGIGIFTLNWLDSIKQSRSYNLHLMRFRNNKWEFILLGSTPLYDVLYSDKLPWEETPIEQYCFEKAIDAAVFPSPLMPNINLPIQCLPCKAVLIIHDLIPLVLKDKYFNKWSKQIQEDYYSRLEIIKKGDLLLAVSKATKNDLVSLLGIIPNKIHVIHESTGQLFKPMDKEDALQAVRLHLELRAPYLFSITGYDPRKNNTGLIKAFSLIHDDFSELNLVILGINQGPERIELQDYAHKLGVGQKVKFLDYVSDELLVALYNACEVFVFPSEYEGFGIPILEALKTGTPVITSNVSSMPEVAGEAALLIDPTNEKSIARAISSVLQSEELKERLAKNSLERAQYFSWEKVANNTFEALKTINKVERCIDKGSRPKLAFFSPLNPQNSGISDYSEELLPHLSEYFDIHVFVNGFKPSNPQISQNYQIHDFSDKKALQTLENISMRLYQMGNNELHYSFLDVIKEYPGIVVLHDYNLFGLFLYSFLLKNRPEEFIEEMAYAHGDQGQTAAEKIVNEGIYPDVSGFPMNKRVIDYSTGIIVHSRWAATEIRKFCFNKPLAKISQAVPLQKDLTKDSKKQIRTKLNLPVDELIIGVFGNVNWNKRPNVVLHSFKRFLETNPNSKLIFVGHCSKEMKDEIESITKQLALNDVIVVGGVELSAFNEYTAASDICINLRWPTMGETSATLLRATSFGIPSIVSNVGSYREYPDDFCWKLNPDEDEEELLLAYLIHLASNPSLREVMGNNAYSFALRELTHQKAAYSYFNFLSYVYNSF